MGGGPAVRVRGMYATAISVRCRGAGMAIADPSDVLRERLSGDFADTGPDAHVADTPDRTGVGISGSPAAVEAVVDAVTDPSADTLNWSAAYPRDAVFAVEIVEENDAGAIARSPAGTAYLPYGRVEGYVSTGDRLLAQVIDPEPPWSPGRRPVLGGDIRAGGPHVFVKRGTESSIVRTPSEELARMVDRVGPDSPDGWGFVLRDGATDLEPGLLRTHLDDAVEAAEGIEAAIASANGPPEPMRIIAPRATSWVRFGRDGRFALDDDRSSVVPTAEGHHRIKAIGDGGGKAIDLLEAHGLDDVPFDPAIMLDVFGPHRDDRVRIVHGRPTGEAIALGRGRVRDVDGEGGVTLEREISGSGAYDALGTPREPGDRAETTFVEGRWWYPTVYRSAEGTYKGTYVNVGTPIELFPDRVQYVDLYVDVIRRPDGAVEIVDESELSEAVARGDLPPALGDRARDVAAAVGDAF